MWMLRVWLVVIVCCRKIEVDWLSSWLVWRVVMVVVVNVVEVDVRVDVCVVGGCLGRVEGGRRRGCEKEVFSGSL